MRVHSAIWISIGILILALSYWMQETLWMASYLGLVFIAWGIAKIIVQYTTREGSKPVAPAYPKTSAQRSVVCKECKGPLAPHYKFCPRCGKKV